MTATRASDVGGSGSAGTAGTARASAPVRTGRTAVWPRVLLAAYTALVLAVTWWPSPESSSAPGWEQDILDSLRGFGLPITMPVLEALANVAMFAPLGALLVAAVWWHRAPAARVLVSTTTAGLLLSALIETVQLAIPGRYSTLQDVVMNTLGAAAGAGVALGVRALARRRESTTRFT